MALSNTATLLLGDQIVQFLELPDFDQMRVVAKHFHRSSSTQERLLLRRRVQTLSGVGRITSAELEELVRSATWDYLHRVAGLIDHGGVRQALNNLRARLEDLSDEWRGALGNAGAWEVDESDI